MKKSNDKKYQVFISSTYIDLIKERKKVVEALLSTSICIPIGMELFLAEDTEQFEIIKEVIDMCDYFILIIGNIYGSINSKTELSYTEMEYDYAVSRGVPVLVFAINNSISMNAEITENKISSAKLVLFRNRVMNNRLAVIWDDVNTLVQRVTVSILKAIREDDRPGWIRGDASFNEDNIIFPERKAYLHNLMEMKISDSRAKKVKIICYGAGKYGKIIEEIIQVFRHIELEVVAYSPYGNFFGVESERRYLEDSIMTMVKAPNVKVFLSEILPTIRASLICDERGSPLFCTTQPYYIYNAPFALVRGDGFTASIVADESDLIINKMEELFMQEFVRLKDDNNPETIESINNAIAEYENLKKVHHCRCCNCLAAL